MENYDFLIYQCFLTGTSLPPTENKRCLCIFFRTGTSLSLISMSNILNLEDNKHFARSDQGLNCLQTKVISKTTACKESKWFII